MGLKCSLLGHDYGDVEVERSREEQGNEVVETVREVKHCERCGAESVVSENTEVRTAVDAEEVGLASDGSEAASAGDAEGEPGLVSAVTRVDEESGAEPGPGTATESESKSESGFDDVTPGDAADHPRVNEDDGFEPATDAEEDDAIILDDEEDEELAEPERAPGEWPNADDTRQAERDTEAVQSPASERGFEEASDAPDAEDAPDGGDAADTSDGGSSWPDHDGEDEGFTAEPGGSTSDAEVSSGQPSPADEAGQPAEGFDAEFIDGTGDTDSPDVDVDDSEGLTCPECGFDAGPSPSLREGDICPECHRGYLSVGASE